MYLPKQTKLYHDKCTWRFLGAGGSARLGDARTGLFLAICEEMLAANVAYSMPSQTVVNVSNPAPTPSPFSMPSMPTV